MKNFMLFLLIAALTGGATWFFSHNAVAARPATATSGITPGRKILYYQSPMHPWIKSDKPGKCPICGMNLVPVYASDDASTAGNGIKLSASNISVANVQTASVETRQIVHSIHVAGTIDMSGPAYFVFTAYEQDFVWLDVGQRVDVTFPAMPGKVYHAKITHFDTQFTDPSRADLTHGIEVRAQLTESLVHVDGIKRWRPFEGFYAEGRVIVNIPDVLTVPRSAVLSPNGEPFVYVDAGGGHYELRKIKLGRIGDEEAEVLDGLKEKEKVVTSGNLLIDAEAQISQNTDN